MNVHERNQFASSQGQSVLHPGFLKFLKDDFNENNEVGAFNFNKYDFQEESVACTEATATTWSRSLASQSLESPHFSVFCKDGVIESPLLLDSHLDNTIQLQRSLDHSVEETTKTLDQSQDEDADLQDYTHLEPSTDLPPAKTLQAPPPSFRRSSKEYPTHLVPSINSHSAETLRALSPIHRRLSESNTKSRLLYQNQTKNITSSNTGSKKPLFYTTMSKSNSFSHSTITSVSDYSPRKAPSKGIDSSLVHMRLSESHTKSTSMRRSQSKKRTSLSGTKKPPFYTTISKANSITGPAITSVPDYSPQKASSKGKKISSTFHNRLMETETYSSSLLRRTQAEKIAFNKYKSNKKPFYYSANTAEKVENTRPNMTRNKKRVATNGIPTKSRGSSTYLSSPVLQKVIVHTKIETLAPVNTPLSRKQSVYDRLAYTGTVSSLHANRKSLSYKPEEKTFGEYCKTALMRDFNGSTQVSGTKDLPIRKPMIGSVINVETK